MPITKEDESIRGRVRDRALWHAACVYPFRFTAKKIRKQCSYGDGQHRTVQRTLREMVVQGWLDHETGSPYYRAGPRLEKLVQRVERRPDWPPEAD